MQLAPDDHDPGCPRAHLLRSAGRPLPWVELRVADPVTGAELGAGEVGEVWLRAPNVTPGYFERPAETAATLTPDGWLRTGDGGYVDEEGYLFLTDRIKDMTGSGGEIMRALDRGETFLVTRNGVPVGELTPLRRRAFVTAGAAVALFSGAPVVELERFRDDVDALLDQDPAPRG